MVGSTLLIVRISSSIPNTSATTQRTPVLKERKCIKTENIFKHFSLYHGMLCIKQCI